MIQKNDMVIFNIGLDKKVYKAITNEYELGGIKVVDLEGYPGEVNVEFLKRYENGHTSVG